MAIALILGSMDMKMKEAAGEWARFRWRNGFHHAPSAPPA